MADNTTLNAGTGGDVIATDDIGGVKYPRSKVGYGADGAYQDVDATHGMPVNIVTPTAVPVTDNSGSLTVDGPLTDTELRASPVPVSAAALPLPADAATQTTLAAILAQCNITMSALRDAITGAGAAAKTLADVVTALASVAVTGPLTDAELRAADVKVTLDSEAVVLGAGSAIAGKVGIDQTTPGITNRVDVGSALPAGNNNIGDVDVATVPADPFGANADAASATGSLSAKLRYLAATGIAGMTALPAGTNLLGAIAAALSTSAIYNGTTALTPKYAIIGSSSAGDNAVVAAVTGKKIRVLQFLASPNAAVNMKWRSATTDIYGPHYAPSQGAGWAGKFCPVGLFETAASEALNLNLSGAVAVGGGIVYVEV